MASQNPTRSSGRQSEDCGEPDDADCQLYRKLLLSLGAVLLHCKEALKEHDACPGCTLCHDTERLLWDAQFHYMVLANGAPCCLVGEKPTREVIAVIQEVAARCRAREDAEEYPDVPTSAPQPELPPAKERPYWLS